MRMSLICLPFVLLPATAFADLSARFIEGAPKDRFEITNSGSCDFGASTVTIDLASSAGALIFDTTSTGAGVEVFQPFETVVGAERLVSPPEVNDGDASVTLNLRDLPPGESVAFTIDVDDTLGAREITVNGSEISGAEVSIVQAGIRASALFGTDARASAALTGPCSNT